MMDTESETFREWLMDMSPRLDRFVDFQAPEGMATDFSQLSLGQLEAHLLGRWPDRKSFEAEKDFDFTDGAVRYIGETFLRLAGGGWHFSDAEGFAFAGRPFIQLDTMDQTPISPYNLMTALLTRRTGSELTKVFGFQQENIDERRAEQSAGWQPHRDSIPGLIEDSDTAGEPKQARDAWVASIDGRVAAMLARAGDGIVLDRTPESLSALADLVLTEFADVEKLTRSGEHAAEYVAYLGEVLRRSAGGEWVLRPGAVDERNAFVGRPYLMRTDEHGDLRTEVPILRLEQLVERRDPGVLDVGFRQYT